MPADVFFDTAVLVYAVTENDPRTPAAIKLLSAGGTLSVQVLNEFALVARRKHGMNWDEVRTAVAFVRSLCHEPVPLSVRIHEAGVGIAARYGFHVYDSMIIAAALDAGCKTLFTEDLQDGQKIETLTVRNPFLTH
jgi:predicted nucleic acid-binding protein